MFFTHARFSFTRIRILERLGEIHRQGLLHGDFAERNVLELDGDIRIIDFDQTEEHNCDCDMNFRPGEKLPDAEEFGCEQLWEICRSDMRLWDIGRCFPYRCLVDMLTNK